MRYRTLFIFVFLTFALFLTLTPGRAGVASADQGLLSDANVAAPASQTQSADLLTLARAKRIALANNPGLVSALERINQAREAVTQAKADMLPTLSANAGWNFNEEMQNSAPDYDETQYASQLSATQVLFDGFHRKYATLSAQYGEKISLAARDEARNLLIWSVAQAFLNVQLARENIKIAESDMAFNQTLETEAAAKERSGAGSYSDLLNFKSKVNSAKSALLSSRQDLVESLHGLAALLGYEDARLPQGMTVGPLEMDMADLNDSLENPRSLEANLETLLSGRPDLDAAALAIRQADAGIRMAKADYYPTISLTGGYGTSASDRFAHMDSMGTYVGVNVSFDIFSGGTKKSKVRAALSQKRELENDRVHARTTALSDIRSSAQNVTTARQQLALQKENTSLIQTTRDLVEKEYNAGQVSLVRLNEAQNDLVGAMGDLAIARVSVILALEAFDYYTGQNIDPEYQ